MDHYLPHPSQDPSEDQSRSSGRWSQDEHHRFIEGLTQYGKNWKKVEDFIGTRSGAQIRSHAQKFFIRLTKEFKKRIDRDNNPNKGNRQRSNSVLSNFSHFSLDNISEEEEKTYEETNKILLKDFKEGFEDPIEQSNVSYKGVSEEKEPILIENPLKIQSETKEPIINTSLIESKSLNKEENSLEIKEKTSLNSFLEIKKEENSTNIEKTGYLDEFLSGFSTKQEDLKKKLKKLEENHEILQIPTYEKELTHYQGIIKFFQGLHSYYESSDEKKPEICEIKENQSFFEFIL